MRAFATVWAGQVVSWVGTTAGDFALSLWVYQRTGSVTLLSLTLFCAYLPGIVAAPFAGVLVDRWDRRRVMLASDLGVALCRLGVLLLLLAGRLELWHIFVSASVASVLSAVQMPAFYASVTQLVPREHLGRASGMVSFGSAVSHICGPALAGVLTAPLGLAGVLMIDFATFFAAVATLLAVRLPPLPPMAAAATAAEPMWRAARYGWRYIAARPGLLGLVLFAAMINFNLAMLNALIRPLVLSFSTPAALGSVLSATGAGLLVGGLAMGAWGGPRRRIRGILLGSGVIGVCLAVAGARPSVLLVGASLFVAYVALAVTSACFDPIWQSKTPAAVQGRVFAIRVMIRRSCMPLAYLLAGPLAALFEPLLRSDGALAGSFGGWIGVGPGRGMGLLFIVLGAALVAFTTASAFIPSIRYVEDRLPDTAPPREEPDPAAEAETAPGAGAPIPASAG
ncbi:MAG TPA: MFS transporter [Longimicrobium sp.]|jgi:predicted MFS family arabinose efflux permease|uniref:MFS transporter n=1 Tax=Longimicrobium sp. TaxID=2029185 RepID=UPI002ED8BD7B